MKNVYYFLLTVCCLSCFLTSCSSDDNNEDFASDLSFQLSVTETSESSARVEIIPSDPSCSYFYSVMPKADYELLNGDQDLYQKDMDYFAERAEEEGKSLNQIISYMLCNGQLIKKIDNLVANTDYCLYVYSLGEDLKQGKVYTAFFSTSTVEKVDFQISLGSITNTSVDVTITPTRDDVTYYFSVVNKNVFDEQILEDEFLVKMDLDKFRKDAINQNKFLNEYLDEVLVKGKTERTVENLRPRTGFYIYVYGLDNQGVVNTEVVKKEFFTQEPEKIEAFFELSISEISSSSATINIVPSDDKIRYYVDYMVKSVYDSEGGNTSVIEKNYYENLALSEKIGGSDNPIEKIVEEMSNFGKSSHNVLRLMTETEYVVYACAIDAWGNIISDIYTENFTTKAIDYSDFQIDIQVEYMQDKVVITTVPSDPDETYIFDFCYGSDIDRYSSDKDIVNMILSFSFDIVSGTQVYEYPRPFNEDKFYALAFGYSKEKGPHTQVFKKAVYNDGPQE